MMTIDPQAVTSVVAIITVLGALGVGFSRINAQIAVMQQTLNQLIKQTSKTLDDHEERLRKLENPDHQVTLATH